MVETNPYKGMFEERYSMKSVLDHQIGETNHYKNGAIQPIEFITKNNLGFTIGNVIKYVFRAEKKGGAEDMKKAIHYAQIELETKYGVKSSIVYENTPEGYTTNVLDKGSDKGFIPIKPELKLPIVGDNYYRFRNGTGAWIPSKRENNKGEFHWNPLSDYDVSSGRVIERGYAQFDLVEGPLD